ncbi:MAG TPA: methyltransferase domain-containing protein [Phnomibacter sp.]|jgi:2-polyprenyl-3-methyl-5-hydroxy-6-metoxy-1,4-benzoquinol methylase|nr:methyltransferase domain-containing protein [Phnomibacter sp.]
MNYTDKSENYFGNARHDLLRILPNNPDARLLEIGAAGGYTLLAAKALGKCGYCAGIELFSLPGRAQQDPRIDAFYVGNIEKDTFPFESEMFDVILFPDVLEHLVDPWAVLQQCTAWLKPGGICIISVPNFQFFKIVFQVFIGGNFAYAKDGIMDRTHLRFFCKPNVMSLANTHPLELSRIYSSFDLQNQWKLKWMNRLTLGLLRRYLTIQFITLSVKANVG